MNSRRFFSAILLAASSALATTAGSGGAEPASIAAATFGGGLTLSGATFVPWTFDAIWKPHGASGMPGGGFVIECSTEGGENAADFGLLLTGSADFRETGDGGVEAVWRLSANRDGNPRQISIQATVPKADIPGGLRADDTYIPVSTAIPPSPHIFMGKVRKFEFLGSSPESHDPDGSTVQRSNGSTIAPWLTLEFPDGAEILVQDNIRWGGQNVSLRLVLASESVEEGREYAVRAVFRTPGAPLSLSVPETVRVEAGPDWTPLPPPEPGADWIEPGSALDFTGVVPHHAPAGKFGRVVAVGDHFEFEGRPGEEVRFCGVNLVHGANVPEPENADRFAANLARMGFNTVRIHHHEAFLVGAKPHGDGAALDVPSWNWKKFDALVAACIRHGLYITTDLFVSRTKGMTWRSIGIDKPGTIPDRNFKLMCAFYEPAYQNLAAWTRIFLTHVNQFTGRSLAEEPALLSIGLINEGNLGRESVHGLQKTPGFLEAWEDSLHRPTVAPSNRPDFPRQTVQRFFDPTVQRSNGPTIKRSNDAAGGRDIPTDVYDNSGKRRDIADLALFLAGREEMLFDRLRSLVRDELGCKAMLSNLNAGYYPAQYLMTMRDFDYIDTHFYSYHPRFLGKNWNFPTVIDAGNPLLANGGIPNATWRRVIGKPFCITEWNWAAPGRHRAASGLVAGSLAALQGWNGLWRFAWSHTKQGVEAPGSMPMRFFDLHSDPVQCASERATLCLFLRGDMPPLPREGESVEEWDEAALRACEAGAPQFGAVHKGVSPWERRVGARLLENAPGQVPAHKTDINAGFVPGAPSPGGNAAPGADGSFSVVTPRTAGGFAEGGALECGPLSFEIVAPLHRCTVAPLPASTADKTFQRSNGSTVQRDGGGPAAVWASSLDGAPLGQSRRILVAHVTDAANSGAVFDGPEARSWIEQGATPPLVRRGVAEISLALAAGEPGAASFAVYPLSPTGHRLAPLPAAFDAATGTLTFTADTGRDPACATFFYEVAAE